MVIYGTIANFILFDMNDIMGEPGGGGGGHLSYNLYIIRVHENEEKAKVFFRH